MKLIHSSALQLQQAVEEKAAVAAQLRAVSQTLQETQDRCHWLETQIQGQVQVRIQDPHRSKHSLRKHSIIQEGHSFHLEYTRKHSFIIKSYIVSLFTLVKQR